MKFSDIPMLTTAGDWECSYGIRELVRQIEEWEDELNLNMNPDFQRGHVWTEDQQEAFVEFILRGGNSGRTLYFNSPSWRGIDLSKYDYNDFVCVDGLQRYTAIKRFIKNEIKAFGYYFREYEDKPRMTISRININVNDLQTKQKVLNWYLEMNSGGTPHTQEELDKVRKMLEEE